MNDALDSNMPTQLVTYEWEDRAEAIIEEYESKGLPPTPGAATQWEMPKAARTASW